MKQRSTFLNLIKISKGFTFFGLFLILFFVNIPNGISSLRLENKNKIKYRTNFGSCPSRSAGQMTLKMIKVFEESGSLRRVKEQVLNQNMPERHFVSDYKVTYDPMLKMLSFNLKCPKPLMKVQIYKDNGVDSYEAILVDSGELYDPTFEVLLRTEEKIKDELPYLAIPLGELEEEIQLKIARVVSQMGEDFRKKISEIILNKKKELTVILSLNGNPSSVFLGPNEWGLKSKKLKRIVAYMETNKKIPAIINLTNSKKVVVKFNSSP